MFSFILKPQAEVDQTWSIARVAQEFPPWSWEELFSDAMPEIENASQIIERYEKQGERFFPLKQDTFAAFKYTPLNEVKVVIVGQDPYPSEIVWTDPMKPGSDSQYLPQATGLSFSIRRGDSLPPTLNNIYKELQSSIKGWSPPNHGDLTPWSKQGVLLLNTVPTFQAGRQKDNAKVFGPVWAGFIKKVLKTICTSNPACIFVLWGKNAQGIRQFIADTCPVLESSHPSPLSARYGFFGCNHFNQINEILIKQKRDPIDWSL